MAAIALAAASLPASSVKSSRRVHVVQPEPLASCASTMAVAELVMYADSSVCARGMWVEAMATDSCADGDVAAQDQAEPPKAGLGPRELGESRGGREGAEPARDHLPAGLDELLVVEREERGSW